MAIIKTDSANYAAIANAIRTQLGVATLYKPSEMAAAILSINASYTLPDYWNTYLETKVERIKAKVDAANDTAVVFGFFTDAHANYRTDQQVDGNAGYTGEIIRYLAAKAGVKRWVFGGDVLSYENSLELCQKSFDEVKSWLAPLDPQNRLIVRGNHDVNPYGEPVLTDAQYHSMFFDALQPSVGGDVAYYYVDDPAKNTRFIVVDTRETSISESYTNGSETEKAYVAAEAAWIISTLASTPGGWQVIVLPHVIWWGGGNMANGSLVLSESGTDLCNLCGYYNQRTSGTIWGQTYDFSAGAANVVLVLSGHTHIDYSRAYNGVVAASTTADSYQAANVLPDSRVHELGTVTEHALDVFIVDSTAGTIETVRIGCGVDREFAIGSGQVCAVTNNLTNCTTSNNATTAIGGYKTTITAADSAKITNGVFAVTCNGYDITAKYCTMSDDGKTLTIDTGSYLPGDLVITARAEAVMIHGVSNNLTNCVSSNAATSVEDGASYTAMLTVNSGYVLKDVTVTMDGADITQAVYSNGTVHVESVTGTIVITAKAYIYYSVTASLTNCTMDGAITAKGGERYVSTISPEPGYATDAIIVTMGGTDVTASAVTGSVISIPNVTGAITITANAVPVAYTNIIGVVGYYDDMYLSGNSGMKASAAGDVTTGYISIADVSERTLYIKGYTGGAGESHTRIRLQATQENTEYVSEINGFLGAASNWYTVTSLGTGYYSVSFAKISNYFSTAQYIRMCFASTKGVNLIITVDEPIE
ncbi:MAG: metallophosphoesterase [Subdoligranulum sp.]|nr:metallophosphoesterase [Subdoligranulum sp.]